MDQEEKRRKEVVGVIRGSTISFSKGSDYASPRRVRDAEVGEMDQEGKRRCKGSDKGKREGEGEGREREVVPFHSREARIRRRQGERA